MNACRVNSNTHVLYFIASSPHRLQIESLALPLFKEEHRKGAIKLHTATPVAPPQKFSRCGRKKII